MEAITFDFKVKYGGETIPATCQVMKKALYPQYRVCIVAESGKEKIFVLYKVNRDNKMFFWFPLTDKKQQLAEAIAHSLENEIKS